MAEKDLQDSNDRDPKKFLFHVNIFDEEEEEEELEEELPPPPTFSEEELAEARKSGYEKGKGDGFIEATKAEEESRGQFIAETLERLSKETQTLFEQERARADMYEQEATELALGIFEKLFPLYNEQHGFDELKHSISQILQKQQNQLEIQIFVQPDIVQDIQALVGELNSNGMQTKFDVQGDETLSNGACRMSWNDGGAMRNPENLAEQIKALMKASLAGKATKSHDSIKEPEIQEPTDMDNAQPLKSDDNADVTGEIS